MSLGTVQQVIRDALARGTSLDAQITAYTRQAARWIERNSTYKYMEKFGNITFNPLAAFPHVIDLPNQRLKSISMFRVLTADGRYHYVRRINPKDQVALGIGRPQGYYLAGYSKIILDNKPDQAYTCELVYNEFSSWPTDLNATNWLLDNAEDVVTAQTLVLMAPYLRDPRLIQTYVQVRDECLHTLEGARFDLEESDTSDVMQYGVGSQS